MANIRNSSSCGKHLQCTSNDADAKCRHLRNTIHVVYFRKALSTSKMMIPGVNFKNVQNLICLMSSTLNSWVGWVFQNVMEHHTCGIFSESPGYGYIKTDDPGCQFQKCPKSNIIFLVFSKSLGTPYM